VAAGPDGRYAECLVREFPDGDDDAGTPPPRSPAGATPATATGRRRNRPCTTPTASRSTTPTRLRPRADRAAVRGEQAPLRQRRPVALRGCRRAEREYYNRDSELILSDTTQAHPLLQGPEDFVQADGTVPIGPSWLLPKKKNTQGGLVSYEGFDVVDFPKDGAESIRLNKADLRDDRDAALAKPAGSRAAGGKGANVTTATTSG
jgi:hypothetical protein